MSRKYYSIGEVSEMIGASTHFLRYMDNILKLKITRIKGRRYYKQDEIDLIKTHIKQKSSTPIDQIIIKLTSLKQSLAVLL
ncbi:MAG: MerR family transcriptional regulator [Rickettsiaceae bacterium]|nr:MerR family transcriptional regulator [Rickettsiaceae bacterium]